VSAYACAVEPQRWKRNGIYEAVVAGGLDPAECLFEYDKVPWRLTHGPSGSYLLVSGDARKYTLTRVVGESPPDEIDAYTWETSQQKVELWAREVKADVDTPDLWAEVRATPEMLTPATYEVTDNRPFTASERAEIGEQVSQIKEYLRTFSPSAAQLPSIEARLDDLVSAAGRVGRKDWLMMFGGAILSVILADLLPHEVVGQFLAPR